MFKSLWSGFHKKNKGEISSPLKPKDIPVDLEMKNYESGFSLRKKDKNANKSKFVNRKNITAGRVTIAKLDTNDVVDENFDLPTKENIYELLDQIPSRVTNHLESYIFLSLKYYPN